MAEVLQPEKQSTEIVSNQNNNYPQTPTIDDTLNKNDNRQTHVLFDKKTKLTII